MTQSELTDLCVASGRLERALHLLNSAKEAVRFALPELLYPHVAGAEDAIDALVLQLTAATGIADRQIEKHAMEDEEAA